MYTILPKLVALAAISLTLSATSAKSAVSVTWDFSPGNEHGWTTVNGVSWLDANGVEAGQADGIGGNNTGNTRRAHDGAHTNFLYRSPVLNFSNVDAVDPVVEFDFEGGAGNQEGSADPLTPVEVTSSGAGITSAVGQKGLAFLNLTTGNYDAVYYDPTNGNGVEAYSLTIADLTTAGIDPAADYRLDYYENDDGGWGWTRLQEVRLDAAALTDAPNFTIFWVFSDGAGGDRGWEAVNGFASFAADGVHASQDGTNFAGDDPHTTLIFRSPMINFSGIDPDDLAIEVDFIGGQGNQSGSPDPADPEAVLAFNGGMSDADGQKGLAFLNLTTGNYDHVIYDSEDGGDNPETISFTLAELTAAGIDAAADYRLDFFENDDGSSGWTRLESVLLNAVVIPDPPEPTDNVVWDFSPGNEHGWTTVNGVSWLDANGVEAGQAEGVGGNDTGNTRRSHDGAHTNFIYRSPVINFASVDGAGSVIEFDFEGGAGNQDGSGDPLNPAAVGTGLSSSAGQKGLAFLNLTTGNYDAVYYDPTDGNGTEAISLSLADMTTAGISLTDSYQLDFYDNDDGGWGWTRLQEVRLDRAALGAAAESFFISEIGYAVETNAVTLTWNSIEQAQYAVKYSLDMQNWDADLDDSVNADPGEETTRTFDLVGPGLAGAARVFFRVERLPPGG